MGFGFNLLFMFVLVPVSGSLIILWIATQKSFYGKILGVIWSGIILLIITSMILQSFTTDDGIQKSEIYGKYIIDTSKFLGPQANWQYDNYRFEITKQDELIFHETDGKIITRSDTAKVEFVNGYLSDRIRIKRDSNMHHIITREPTLYRTRWSFYYVFKSPKFGNVFFTKGKWKPINQK